MNEEISSTGQFASLATSEALASYQPTHAAAQPSVRATAPQTSSVAAVATTTKSAKPPSTQDINSAVAAANANLASSDRVLDYHVDATTGLSVALIRNSQTGVVL